MPACTIASNDLTMFFNKTHKKHKSYLWHVPFKIDLPVSDYRRFIQQPTPETNRVVLTLNWSVSETSQQHSDCMKTPVLYLLSSLNLSPAPYFIPSPTSSCHEKDISKSKVTPLPSSLYPMTCRNPIRWKPWKVNLTFSCFIHCAAQENNI